MRICITGVAGFLGSNLAQRYLMQGHTVIGVDNFASSEKDSRHMNLLRKMKSFEFIQDDICDAGVMKYAVPKVDLVLNFACIASPPRYQANPLETIRTSTTGVDNILHYAFRLDVPVVHSSTSEIYGDPEVSPQVETYWGRVNSFGPRSCYDEGKRCAESYCYEYLKKGADVRIVRIFNTYGPNMHPDDGRAVSNFINQALNNKDITIHGDGQQTRSFCYVSDLVTGIMSVAALKRGSLMTPINLGNPTENTVSEIAEMVLDRIPESKSNVVYVDRPIDDPCRRRPDIALAKEKLSWSPQVCLDEGLNHTIKYFKMIK